MKKYFIAATCMVLAAMMFWLVGCSKDEKNITSPSTLGSTRIGNQPVSPNAGGGGPQGGKPAQNCNGTTLTDGSVSIECFNYYDWSCTKTTEDVPCLKRGEFKDIASTVSVVKGAQHVGFTGQICITNGGAVATENLRIEITLERLGACPHGVVAGPISVDVSGNSVLDPTERGCYTYSIEYPCDPACSWRINAAITITNHSGAIGPGCPQCPSGWPGPGGCPFGPTPKSNSVPCCPQATNDCIDVTDAVGTPINSLNLPDATSWSFDVSPASVNVCASGDVPFTVRVTNVNAPVEETWTVVNTATVDNHNCEATFGLNTVGCNQNPGCSFTQGFWKTHGCVGPNGKSQYGNNPDLITALLGTPITMGARTVSTCAEAGAVFQGAEGNQGNAIKRLYSQILAALLNIRNGADGSCVSAAIAAANAVLGAADPNGDASGWTGISGANRSAVQSAASTFDQYNNGLLCVPHCE